MSVILTANLLIRLVITVLMVITNPRIRNALTRFWFTGPFFWPTCSFNWKIREWHENAMPISWKNKFPFKRIKVIDSFVCLPHKFELSSLLSSQSGSPSHCHLEGIHLPSVQRNSAALQDVFSTGSWLIQKRKYAKS